MSIQDMTFHNDSFNFDPATLQQKARGGDDGPLPTPGYYKVKVVSGGVKKNKETGELILDKKGNPIFYINRIAIMDGGTGQPGGSYAIWQDIYTNGFDPRNWKTGEVIAGPKTYPFVELLAACDASAPTTDFNENCHELAKLLSANPEITVRLGYTGTDVAYAKAQMSSGVDKKPAYKAAELKPAAFRNQDGTWRTTAQGPSGEMVEAKLKITEFIPSNQTIELGPVKMRGQK